MSVTKYQCKWCGRTSVKTVGIPLKTKCSKAPGGFHAWVKIQTIGKK